MQILGFTKAVVCFEYVFTLHCLLRLLHIELCQEQVVT